MSLVLVEIITNLPFFFYRTAIFYELLTFLSLIVFLRYRIRVGDMSGSVDNGYGNAGLTYSNGMYFSTFDRDNDETNLTNCAMHFKAGWWYHAKNFKPSWWVKNCYRSQLNAPAPLSNGRNEWYNGHKWIKATLTAMKIRPL